MSLKDGKPRESSAVLLTVVMLAVAFIIVVSGEAYGNSNVPIISTYPYTSRGLNVTVTGQNFTPDGTAILYGSNYTFSTATVDKTGNVSWTYTNPMIAPYPIQAVDMITNTTSNTITVLSSLNDWKPTPTPTPFPAGLWVLLTVYVAAMINIGKKMR